MTPQNSGGRTAKNKVWLAVALLSVIVGGYAYTSSLARAEATRKVANITEQLGVQYPEVVSMSPDGRLLLLKTLESDSFDLRVIDRATGRELRRHSSYERQMSPSWRPDSKAIAFLQDSGDNPPYRLVIWDLLTGTTMHPSATPTSSLALAWSPDGARIAYISQSFGEPMKSLMVLTLGRRQTQQVVLTGLSPRAAIAWSPDSKLVVTTLREAEGSLAIASLDGATRRIHVLRGELRALTWLQRCGCILVVGRTADDEFMQLLSVMPQTGEVRRVHESQGDIPSISSLAGGFTFQVTTDGMSYAVISRDTRGFNPVKLDGNPGTLLLLGTSARGDTAFGISTGMASPPKLISFLLNSPTIPTERRLSSPGESHWATAEKVNLLATDGLRIPAYVWRPDRGPAQNRALVLVHGGPRLQTMRTWDAGIQNAVREGFNVIALNYRGSSGYGAEFESFADDIDGQVADIEAASRYAEQELKVPRQHVVLWGQSYGALIVSRAIAATPGIAGKAILISLVPDPSAPRAESRKTPRIVLFQGERDVVQGPHEARDQLLNVFGGRRLRHEAIPDEGHNFRRLHSWARVYAAAMDR